MVAIKAAAMRMVMVARKAQIEEVTHDMVVDVMVVTPKAQTKEGGMVVNVVMEVTEKAKIKEEDMVMVARKAQTEEVTHDVVVDVMAVTPKAQIKEGGMEAQIKEDD